MIYLTVFVPNVIEHTIIEFFSHHLLESYVTFGDILTSLSSERNP
jgi:hypothetical protein